MTTALLESRRWRAVPRNVSPNGIHDDDRARELGFEGGFVTGVTLYEHVAAKLLDQDPEWLSHGRVEMPPKPGVHPREDSSIRAMLAYVPFLDAAGVKWISGYGRNYIAGLPKPKGCV